MKSARHLALLLLVSLAGCGQQEEPAQISSTPYGSVQEVTDYLVAIDPIIRQMGTIQMRVDKEINATGKATGENLARTMEQVRPRLQEVLTEFEGVAPPPLLAPFHREIKQLMVLGLDAYSTTIKGWKLESEKQDLSLYQQAEAKMAEAKRLSGNLDQEMRKIQQALVQAPPPQQATP